MDCLECKFYCTCVSPDEELIGVCKDFVKRVNRSRLDIISLIEFETQERLTEDEFWDYFRRFESTGKEVELYEDEFIEYVIGDLI